MPRAWRSPCPITSSARDEREPATAEATPPGAASDVGSTGADGSGDLGTAAFLAVQRVLQLGLGLLGQRRLEHRATEPAQRLDRLVRSHLLDDQEKGGGAWFQHVAYLFLELLVDRSLRQLAHERAHTGAHC